MSSFPSKHVTGQRSGGASGSWHLQVRRGHDTRRSQIDLPTDVHLLPVVLHHVQVGLQGGQEELQDLGVGQQLGGSPSDGNQPLQEIVVGQLASLRGLGARL